MRALTLLLPSIGLALAGTAGAAELVFVVDDPGGTASRVAAPVSVAVDLGQFSEREQRRLLSSGVLVEEEAGPVSGPRTIPIPVQFMPEAGAAEKGRLWWLLPPGTKGERRFRWIPQEAANGAIHLSVGHDEPNRRFDVAEQGRPVLRYNHGRVPVPEGTHAHFAAGESYERGDYLHPLFGPNGEVLTDDYPEDHPHHRGVWWSWPVTRWKEEVGDIWAVVGVWARPGGVAQVSSGPVFAAIEAENVWEFGKEKVPIVREEVLIQVFPQSDQGRLVDVEVRLTALADHVAIGGRPKRGYGGFSLRAAPCEERKITLHSGTEGPKPQRSWIDYSGVFPGAKGRSGVALFEHVSNPDYPNPLHEYPGCNCVMPAYPETREVVLSRESPLVLKHRLWIHGEDPPEEAFSDVWASYAAQPKVALVSK